MDFREKERNASAIGRQDIPLLMVQALHQAFPREAAEVVPHLARGVGRTDQRRDERSELGVGEAVGGPQEVAEAIEEGGDARLAKLEGRCRLTLGGLCRLDQIGQLRRGEPAVVGEGFGLEHATIDVVA